VFGLDTHIDVIKHHGGTDPLIILAVLEHHGIPKEQVAGGRASRGPIARLLPGCYPHQSHEQLAPVGPYRLACTSSWLPLLLLHAVNVSAVKITGTTTRPTG
jgi:hypothetical protein